MLEEKQGLTARDLFEIAVIIDNERMRIREMIMNSPNDEEGNKQRQEYILKLDSLTKRVGNHLQYV